MTKAVQFEFAEMRRLLLDPTPKNVDRVAELLQPVEESLHALTQLAMSVPTIRVDLIEMQSEMRRVRNLLESAAKFYNLIAAAHSASAYQRNGLLSTGSESGRTLARL